MDWKHIQLKQEQTNFFFCRQSIFGNIFFAPRSEFITWGKARGLSLMSLHRALFCLQFLHGKLRFFCGSDVPVTAGNATVFSSSIQCQRSSMPYNTDLQCRRRGSSWKMGLFCPAPQRRCCHVDWWNKKLNRKVVIRKNDGKVAKNIECVGKLRSCLKLCIR